MLVIQSQPVALPPSEMPETRPTCRLNLRADFVLLRALRRYCDAHGLTLSETIRRALRLLIPGSFFA